MTADASRLPLYRPARGVELRVIAEMASRLNAWQSTRDYTLFGFSSLDFEDFRLLHEALRCKNMIAVSDDAGQAARARRNRPLAGIRVSGGGVHQALNLLRMNTSMVAVLDYDRPLDRKVLDEVGAVVGRCQSGSLVAVTVDADPLIRYGDAQKAKEDAVAGFLREFQDENVRVDFQAVDLEGRGTADEFAGLLANTIRGAADAAGRADQGLVFSWVMNLRYLENHERLTVAGIVHVAGHRAKFEGCGFGDLDYYSPDGETALLEVPLASSAEMAQIRRNWRDDTGPPKIPGVSEGQVRHYGRMFPYMRNWKNRY